MKHSISLFAAALIALVPMADVADAKDKNKSKHKIKGGHAELSIKAKPGKVKVKIKGGDLNFTAFCPPGLAKKNPPCIPPGQVRTYDHDRYDDHDYVLDYDLNDHDDGHIVHQSTTYDIDTTYSETDIRQITEVTTIYGDVIHIGDVILNEPMRYSVLDDPAIFGLPLVEDDIYLRVGDTAVRLDRQTQRVVTILALADVLIQ